MASDTDNDLFSGALSLPVRDRARLAHELLRSLDESDESDAAGAWLEEIERRAREVRDGHVDLEDWPSVHQRLQGRWSKR
jgi:hypothetical protein